jgi:hypothetical protein
MRDDEVSLTNLGIHRRLSTATIGSEGGLGSTRIIGPQQGSLKSQMPWRCFAFTNLIPLPETVEHLPGVMLLQTAVIVNLNLGSLLLFIDRITA